MVRIKSRCEANGDSSYDLHPVMERGVPKLSNGGPTLLTLSRVVWVISACSWHVRWPHRALDGWFSSAARHCHRESNGMQLLPKVRLAGASRGYADWKHWEWRYKLRRLMSVMRPSFPHFLIITDQRDGRRSAESFI